MAFVWGSQLEILIQYYTNQLTVVDEISQVGGGMKETEKKKRPLMKKKRTFINNLSELQAQLQTYSACILCDDNAHSDNNEEEGKVQAPPQQQRNNQP